MVSGGWWLVGGCPVVGFGWLVVGFWWLVVGFWWLVVGFWWLVVVFWWLVVVFWWLVVVWPPARSLNFESQFSVHISSKPTNPSTRNQMNFLIWVSFNVSWELEPNPNRTWTKPHRTAASRRNHALERSLAKGLKMLAERRNNEFPSLYASGRGPCEKQGSQMNPKARSSNVKVTGKRPLEIKRQLVWGMGLRV